MEGIEYRMNGGTLDLKLSGRISSANSGAVEAEIVRTVGETAAKSIEIDCEKLEFISSAGLRVILRLKKSVPDTRLVSVTPEVYDVFEMTGFTELMDISRAYRVISVDGCEVIGRGANGEVYRIDPDTIVKVYLNDDAISDIHRERELARKAFVLGIPTAISYDVVKIASGGYGSVFELLNAESFAKLLSSGKKTVDEIAKLSVDLLKQLHSTEVDPASMPDRKEKVLRGIKDLEGRLAPELTAKLRRLVEEIPDRHTMLHGDYHLKNVMLQNGETLLIDMDTLCWGHPVFELAGMFTAYRGFSMSDHSVVLGFLGIPYEVSCKLMRRMLGLYLDTDDEAVIDDAERKAELLSCSQLMRYRIRHNGGTDAEKLAYESYKRRLEELIPETDKLWF